MGDRGKEREFPLMSTCFPGAGAGGTSLSTKFAPITRHAAAITRRNVIIVNARRIFSRQYPCIAVVSQISPASILNEETNVLSSTRETRLYTTGPFHSIHVVATNRASAGN
jgi:hypothetical protein